MLQKSFQHFPFQNCNNLPGFPSSDWISTETGWWMPPRGEHSKAPFDTFPDCLKIYKIWKLRIFVCIKLYRKPVGRKLHNEHRCKPQHWWREGWQGFTFLESLTAKMVILGRNAWFSGWYLESTIRSNYSEHNWGVDKVNTICTTSSKLNYPDKSLTSLSIYPYLQLEKSRSNWNR